MPLNEEEQQTIEEATQHRLVSNFTMKLTSAVQ